MSIALTTERARGCGYRKGGGLYLCAGFPAASCGRFPVPLSVCPTCHGGIKQSRGWTWIEPAPLFLAVRCRGYSSNGNAIGCGSCPVNDDNVLISAALRVRAGLLWIGEQFYATPSEFLREGMAQGISRRISALPNDFVVGQTRIFFAHAKAVSGWDDEIGEFVPGADGMGPGLFASFVASRIDYIVKDEERAAYQSFDGMSDIGVAAAIALGDEPAKLAMQLRDKEKRGITLVYPTRIDEHGQRVDERGRPTGDVLEAVA